MYKVNIKKISKLYLITILYITKLIRPFFTHYMHACSFIPSVSNEIVSNMAVMEISFPSGFVADLDTLPSLKSLEHIKKVETKNGDTVAMIYFDNLTENEICLTIDGYRTHKVAHQKPASIIIYDYYDNSNDYN